jgi:hypothetical protein
MKIVPTITWAPCNPVEAKNTVPNTESAKEKLDSKYSKAWKPVNIMASTNVKNVPNIALFRFPWIKAWWAQVINAPLDSSKIVFNNGIVKGSGVIIPIGGHDAISIAGAKLEWK